MNPISVFIFATCCLGVSRALVVPDGQSTYNKVFNYVGPMPLKEERVDGANENETNNTSIETTTMSLSEQEAICWEVIVEQSSK